MSKTIFIFNSPAGTGKDVLCDYISKGTTNVKVVSFKERLIEITMAVYGVSRIEWDDMYTREGKETPHWKLKNHKHGEWLSPRKALIHISENVIKPNHGKDYFGNALLETIKNSTEDIILVSDGGFKEEVLPIISEWGKENVIKVVTHRVGHTFSGDSRGDIPNKLFGATINLYNDKSLQEFLDLGFTEIANYLRFEKHFTIL